MVYTVFYKTSSFAGYCFLDKNSIHPKRYGVFSFKAFIAVLVKIQICSFIAIILYFPSLNNPFLNLIFILFIQYIKPLQMAFIYHLQGFSCLYSPYFDKFLRIHLFCELSLFCVPVAYPRNYPYPLQQSYFTF